MVSCRRQLKRRGITFFSWGWVSWVCAQPNKHRVACSLLMLIDLMLVIPSQSISISSWSLFKKLRLDTLKHVIEVDFQYPTNIRISFPQILLGLFFSLLACPLSSTQQRPRSSFSTEVIFPCTSLQMYRFPSDVPQSTVLLESISIKLQQRILSPSKRVISSLFSTNSEIQYLHLETPVAVQQQKQGDEALFSWNIPRILSSMGSDWGLGFSFFKSTLVILLTSTVSVESITSSLDSLKQQISTIFSCFSRVSSRILSFLFLQELKVERMGGVLSSEWIITSTSQLQVFLKARNILMFSSERGIRDWCPVMMLQITRVLPHMYASLFCSIQSNWSWLWRNPMERTGSSCTPFKKRVPDSSYMWRVVGGEGLSSPAFCLSISIKKIEKGA